MIDTTTRTAAERHLLRSAEVKRLVAADALDAILAVAEVLASALRDGGKVLLCGNGGSAADCQHLAAELVSRLSRSFDRPALPAVALTTDTSLLTAVANDCGFEEVFERQVEALGRQGDVLIAISTSGDSENVVRAARAAARLGMRTVALTGPGGLLGNLPGVTAVRVPSDRTAHVQEAHLAIEHVLADLVERSLFGREGEDDDH